MKTRREELGLDQLELGRRVGGPAGGVPMGNRQFGAEGGVQLAGPLLDALLSNRGAIANARVAVEQDRAAARPREQAALAVARVAGHRAGSRHRTPR